MMTVRISKHTSWLCTKVLSLGLVVMIGCGGSHGLVSGNVVRSLLARGEWGTSSVDPAVVAVMPFRARTEGRSCSLGVRVRDDLSQQLLDARVSNMRIVDSVAITSAIRVRGGRADALDDERALEVGLDVGADIVIVGYLEASSSEYRLVARAIRLSDGTVLSTSDARLARSPALDAEGNCDQDDLTGDGTRATSGEPETRLGVFHHNGGSVALTTNAGGSFDVNGLEVTGCVGWVTDAAAFRFEVPTPVPNLRVRVDSRAGGDATLVVRQVDGPFHCNDDTNGLDPQVDIPNASGTYLIWVGAYSETSSFPVDMVLEETPPVSSRFSGMTGGTIDVNEINRNCLGFVGGSPQHEIPFSSDANVRVQVESATDTTLFLATEDDVVVCSDNANGLMPIIDVRVPRGRLRVWVGVKESGLEAPYSLVVSPR